jgi:hypothetical protein
MVLVETKEVSANEIKKKKHAEERAFFVIPGGRGKCKCGKTKHPLDAFFAGFKPPSGGRGAPWRCAQCGKWDTREKKCGKTFSPAGRIFAGFKPLRGCLAGCWTAPRRAKCGGKPESSENANAGRKEEAEAPRQVCVSKWGHLAERRKKNEIKMNQKRLLGFVILGFCCIII